MCGIFGKISAKEEKLELSHFNVLGFANDERGGDSVGVFIDGELEIGIDSVKKYPDFMKKSKILSEADIAKIAIGHTRKASIGKVNVDTAQPVCILNEKNEVDFLLVHNGTIFNYLDLAKKHIPFLDIKDLTDTQVMANIFYFCGYDVLAEYEGAGAFVIVDYRELKNGNPTILFFKGASLRYKYSKEIEEERPLYMTISDSVLWFSSLGKPLTALNYPLEALTIRANTIIKVNFKNDKLSLVCVKEYDRSKQFQYKSTYQSDSEYCGYGASGYGNSGFKGYKSDKSDRKVSPITTSRKDANYLWIDESYNYIKDKVSLHSNGLYYINHKKAHGSYRLNFYGHFQHENTAYVHEEGVYFFFMGRLLPNENVYKILSDAATFANEGHEQFAIKYSECIDKYSYIPVVNLSSEGEILFFEQEDFDKTFLFDGEFRTMFSFNNFSYTVKNGIITKRGISGTPSESRKIFELFVDMWSEEMVDYNEESNDMIAYICNKDKIIE